VLWRYAIREHLVRPDADDEEVQLLTQRLTPGLAGYLVLIIAGLFCPVAERRGGREPFSLAGSRPGGRPPVRWP
jgi:hypothetical protein